MSQPQTLSIPAMRWLSLLLCAITAATITIFLSKVGFVQKAYASWGAILNTNPVIHYSSAFLAGIGIKLLLDKFYISHPKRGIGFSWRYPPVTIAVWLSVAALLIYLFVNAAYRAYFLDDDLLFSSLKYVHITLFSSALFALFQEPKDKAKKLNGKSWFILFTALVILLFASGFYHTPWPLITTFTLLYCLAVILRLRASSEIKQPHSQSSSVEANTGDGLNDLDDFRQWFKDDSIIKNTEELEPDLQVYAKRITERLQNGGDKYEKGLAQHIALCGPYGCGKSSIVESIVNDLAKNSEKESIWIHSDISTWGAESGSVAHVVLSHIIDDISQHIDMCSFRALPKHYTEALKSGGSFFQFASTLLAGPVDTDARFQKLNKVLQTTNHKLLITLQDVDRATDEESEKRLNDIAALLDRMKDRKLSQINFIVAMGNEDEVVTKVIPKATDYREDIARIDFRIKLASFIKASIDEAKKEYSKIILYSYSPTHETNKLDLVNAIIDSPRQLKKILRRVNQAWQSEKLMGEVKFYSLLMVIALRETNPTYFEGYCKADSYLESKIKSNEDDLDNVLREIAQLSKEDSGRQQSSIIKSEFIYGYLQVMLDVKKDSDGKLKLDPSKDHEQSVGCTHSDVYYLRRILLEKVPSNELKDQDVMKAIKSGGNKEKLNNYIHEAQYTLFESNSSLSSKSTW